jgi:hypothetical protein
MVRGHTVTKNPKRARAFDVCNGPGLEIEIRKEGRFLNIRALGVPLINVACRAGNLVPLRILLRKIAVKFAEDLRLESRLHLITNFLEGGPDLTQVNVLAIFAFAKGLLA